MIFSGSLIKIRENGLEDVKEFLNSYPQIEIYSFSGDKQSIIVAIEEESEAKLEELCKKLSFHEDIRNITHHYFRFEEETD